LTRENALVSGLFRRNFRDRQNGPQIASPETSASESSSCYLFVPSDLADPVQVFRSYLLRVALWQEKLEPCALLEFLRELRRDRRQHSRPYPIRVDVV